MIVIIHCMILEKMKPCSWKLELEFWAYGLIHPLGPSTENVVCRPQTRKSSIFEISWLYWIHLMIVGKTKFCLWKLETGFWTYSKICLLGPSNTNVVFRLQTPKSSNFLRFHNLIAFIHCGENKVLFVKNVSLTYG